MGEKRVGVTGRQKQREMERVQINDAPMEMFLKDSVCEGTTDLLCTLTMGPGPTDLLARRVDQTATAFPLCIQDNFIKDRNINASNFKEIGDQPRPELRLYPFMLAHTCTLADHTHTPVIHAAVFPFLLAGYPLVECQSTVFSSPASWQLVRGRAALRSLLSSLGSGEDRLTGWHMLDSTSTCHCGALRLSARLSVHQSSQRSHNLPPLRV
ncbi:unnamed protein product [Leuciscus chuanchicus]